MDSFDKTILQQLQQDSRISTEKLGELIGLSASACQRRIKKLKQAGIIAKEVAIIDRSKMKGLITVITDVTLEKGGEAALNEFMLQAEKETMVQQFYYVAGEVDFVVIAVTESMDEYDNLSRRLFMANDNVKKFTSKVAIKSCATDLSIPI